MLNLVFGCNFYFFSGVKNRSFSFSSWRPLRSRFFLSFSALFLNLASQYEVGDGPRVPIGESPPASVGEVPSREGHRVSAIDNWDEDRFSFEDSDRFEEDSLCSWSTEPESLCNNWRGWKKPGTQGNGCGPTSKRFAGDTEQKVPSLTELTAKCVASHIPFELVEHVYPPVPEQLQLRIAFWSFPDNEEDIRLYSCLASGSADEFQKGEHLYRIKCVQDPLQIGFHLSATVVSHFVTNSREHHNVAVTFDRRRITSCNCTCSLPAYWCSHVVAVCLYRINNPYKVCLRAPVSESLSRLKREQLQKFAQYLISELPQQILPTAQRLLDELLSGQPSAINSVCGAPDPTAGASISDQTSWYLDQKTLHDNIKKILIKFCVPAPMVFSDVNCLSTTAPPAAAEWTSLLRPLRGREPEGMWNLLSIVVEMYKRNDRNAVPLLEIITEECMACEQILVWWYITKAALHSGRGGGKHSGANSNTLASQHACSSLCDEIVALWRLAALNPGISPEERLMLEKKFTSWHTKIIEKVAKSRGNHVTVNHANVFPGFKVAIQACRVDWEDYPIPGITYTSGSNQLYHCPFTCFKHNEGNVNQVNSSHVVLNCHPHPHYGKHLKKMFDLYHTRHSRDHNSTSMRNGYRSSVSSEGFCENEADTDMPSHSRAIANEQDDADSQEGGGSDSASSSDAGTTCQATHKSGSNEKRNGNSKTNKKTKSFGMKEQSQSSEDSDARVFMDDEDEFFSNRSKKLWEDPSDTVNGCLGQPEEEQNNCTKNPNVSLINNDLNSENVVSKQGECESEGDSPRRASNDSATSNSDSQQSGDEYNVYYISKDSKKPEESQPSDTGQEKEDVEQNKSNEGPNESLWNILFARSEGLHAHGHAREACKLAVRLALELLANPPNLLIEIPPFQTKGKRRKINPASHQISCLASATLTKCAFLCSVLSEVPEYQHVAFRVGLFGLELARPPASIKPLEVKMINQESDLVSLMKRIPLGSQELAIIKEKAEQLRDGTLRTRGEALLPIMLASFIFDALEGSPSLRENKLEAKNPADEALAFEAAVAALGLKANVSEADHPLLCEGTRRQRGDLALTLLMHYKDEPGKLTRIMEKLLDREVHNLIKTPLCGWYYSTSTHPKMHSKRLSGAGGGEEEAETLAAAFLTGYDPVSQELPNALGSRPHSSTSAEPEQGLASINLMGSTQSGPIPRGKDTPRFKGKRMYPSIPNQPSEAGAHFMFELAKTVLNKAGGNSSTSLFTQASTSQQHHGPHRALHFCAFQIGLYALGLHNCVSPNWLSRTYSSHVSWITGQAMEIGAHAVSFLIDTWEGHLTPPEAASIADRASRARDLNMVRAAAELALSCLPHAHALNPNEIQRAIVQCKEQSEVMLERSCLTVENAAKGGGVYPEVLFQVAKYWYDLYMKHTPRGEQPVETEVPHDPMSFHFSLVVSNSGVSLVEPQEIQQHSPMPSQIPANVNSNMNMMTQPPPQGGVVMTTAPPPLLPVPYAVSPYSFAVHPIHSIPPPSHLSLYLSPPQYPYPNNPPGPMPQQYFVQGNSQPPLRPIAYPITTMQQVVPNQNQLQVVQPQNAVAVTSSVNVGLQQQGPPVAVPVSVNQPPLPPIVPGRSLPQPQVHRQGQNQYTTAQFRCLFAAYRVGMLALETLARRVHDDRPQAKYARNPPYGDDVKWLLQVSKKLGTQYLHQFCMYVVNSIVSPFILHEVAIEAAHYLGRSNPSLILQHLRTSLTPLVQKCQKMYIQCIHHKLYLLTSGDYEDFVNVICTARAAFLITPEGSQQFKEWLQFIKRSKSCKKELWTQINTALQANNK